MAHKVFVAIKALDLSLHRALADGFVIDDDDSVISGSHDLAAEVVYSDTSTDIHQKLADAARSTLGSLATLDLSSVKVYFTDSPGHY